MSAVQLVESTGTTALTNDEIDALVSVLTVVLEPDILVPWATTCPSCGTTMVQYKKGGVTYWHCNNCGYDTGK